MSTEIVTRSYSHKIKSISDLICVLFNDILNINFNDKKSVEIQN